MVDTKKIFSLRRIRSTGKKKEEIFEEAKCIFCGGERKGGKCLEKEKKVLGEEEKQKKVKSKIFGEVKIFFGGEEK